MAVNPDIETAVKKFKDQSTVYDKPTKYYDGDHEMQFATEKFKNTFGKLFREFSLNYCPAVVDALQDNLVITGFNVEEGENAIPEKAWKIWQANRMENTAAEIHQEAIKNGDAYAIVWPDAEKKVTIYPQKAKYCTVIYDEETPGKRLWAAKYWNTKEKFVRLNLYYPDRTERYISTKESKDTLPDPKEFIAYAEGDGPLIKNPYNIVPVFHFANNASLGSSGVSELKGAMPVQDALNKSVLDMMVAMEFSSYRQRWASGIELELDEAGNPIPPFKAGIDKLWITESPDAKFGDFDATDLEQFLKVKDSFRIDFACVTGTPIYYLMLTEGDFPSGEALKKAETRFIKKVKKRQGRFGQVWEDLMSFALMMENRGQPARLLVTWEDPSPVSEKEKLENIVVKQEIGISEEQALTEAGYGEADIIKMLAAKEEKRKKSIKGFNAGEEGTLENL